MPKAKYPGTPGPEFYKGRDGIRWRLWSNGRIVAESGEAYTRKAGALRGLHATYKALAEAIWR